ncbi:hypothetical protein AHAS_Ahas18G0163600 [Arachis hypogaea]
MNIVDPSLENNSSDEMMRCIHIGLLCVQENPAERPTMSSIISMLKNYSITLLVPLEPAFTVTSNQSLGILRDVLRPVKLAADRDARLVWKFERQGVFTTNSFVQVLQEETLPEDITSYSFTKTIWKGLVPPRVELFAWFVCMVSSSWQKVVIFWYCEGAFLMLDKHNQ